MSDQVTAREVAELLGDLIENIGYPVGMGMRPDPGTLERLATRALAAAVAGEWRPIETAPTNGTQVLLCYRREDLGKHWPLVLIAGMDSQGYWVWQGRASRAYSAKPIGWMPLPAPLTAPAQPDAE